MRAVLSFLLLTANFVLLAYCDNLGTLRRYEKAACEDESLALSCPPGTSISVEMAHYGTASRAASTLCPPPPPPHVAGSGDAICDPPSSLQYSLLQTVVEACQKKRSCKFQTSTKSFGGDPCPGVQKYVIVAYKCRPYEFRSKVACENDVVQLQCNPNSRIAVYSASYGRTEYESVQCPQPQGVPEETCLVSYATETVMQICHGKRRCTLSADAATFGSPCKKESRMYLKVVYTCVPRKVLRDQYEERPEEDENLDMDDDAEYEVIEETENNSLLPSPNLAGRHNATSVVQNGGLANGGVTFAPILRIPTIRPPVNRTAPPPIEENKEKLTLYVIVSVGAGLVCVMGLAILRLAWSRHKAKRQALSAAHADTTHLPPRPFTDDLSEVEADIDLTLATPVALMHHHSPPPAEVVRYTGEGTAPRSLSRSGGNAQYYYG